jgi:hypothetical protein
MLMIKPMINMPIASLLHVFDASPQHKGLAAIKKCLEF